MYEPDSSSSSVVSSSTCSPPGGSGIKRMDTSISNGTNNATSSTTTNGSSFNDKMATGSTTLQIQSSYESKMDTSYGHDDEQGAHWLTKGTGQGNPSTTWKMEPTSSTTGVRTCTGGSGTNGQGQSNNAGGGGGASAAETGQNQVVSQVHGTNQQDQQPEQSSSLSSTQNVVTPTRNKPQKVCQVCGDKAKSFHFGGLSCDSCKAFFRRSVHNDAHKGFQCIYKCTCEITMNTRKTCQFCRFKKCLEIGMEKSWVMTEEEKSQLQKQRNDKKETISSPAKSAAAVVVVTIDEPSTAVQDDKFEPNVADMLKYMTVEERDEIESICIKYQHSYREIPFRVAKFEGNRNSVEIIKMFTTILRRFAYFTKLIPEFAALSVNDQSTLLRAGVLEMCLLRSALAFDMKHNRWPKTENMEFLKDCPQLRVEDMEKLVSKDLYHMHMQFINGIQELNADEPTVMILLLIVLFYPEHGPLEQQDMISKAQEKYLLLLNKYVQWRYGTKSSKVFPKLLTRLADLRQLNDFHTEYNLRMSKTEVEEIQEQLGNINLNPYPQWVLVEDQQKLQDARSRGASSSAMTTGDSSSAGSQHSAFSYAEGLDGDGEGLVGYPEQYAQASGELTYEAPTRGFTVPPQQQTASEPPSMRHLFMQFVNQKIPTLIADPFAVFPMEQEMASATAFFQQLGPQAGQMPGLQSLFGTGAGGGPSVSSSAFQRQQTHPSQVALSGPSMESYHQPVSGSTILAHSQTVPAVTEQHQHQMGLSQISNILESSDPNSLRQLKDNLSPTVLAKLSSIFGNGSEPESVGGGGTSMQAAAADFLSGNLDLSRIPPELISSFLNGGGFGGSAAAPSATAVRQSVPPTGIEQQTIYQQHLPEYGGRPSGLPASTYQHQSNVVDGYQQHQAPTWQPHQAFPGNWAFQHHHEIRTSPTTGEHAATTFGHHEQFIHHHHHHQYTMPSQNPHPQQFEHSPNSEQNSGYVN